MTITDWIQCVRRGECSEEYLSYVFTHSDELIDLWWDATWQEKRALILARDGSRCLYCDERATHVDHLHPRSRGGGDEWWNLAASCRAHNLLKHAKVLPWVTGYQQQQANRVAAFADAELAA